MSGVSKICSTSQRLQPPSTSIAMGNGHQPRSLRNLRGTIVMVGGMAMASGTGQAS